MRKYLVTGLLIWIPLVITLWVLDLIVSTLDQSLRLLPVQWHPRVLVGHDEGLLFVDLLAPSERVLDIGMDLPRPVIGFAGYGTILAVSAAVGRVYDSDGTRIDGRAEFETSVSDPFAIVPGWDAGCVALVGAHTLAMLQFGVPR